MRRTVRRCLTPKWVLWHLLAWAAAITMVLLGRWQLDVSNTKHFDLQNFGYSLQWWAFALALLAFWAKTLRDAVRTVEPRESVGGELAVRAGRTDEAYAGPAELVAWSSGAGDPTGLVATAGEPIVYRGYRMPQSETNPDRSDNDPLRGEYNDYLWQLALADSARRRGQGGGPERP